MTRVSSGELAPDPVLFRARVVRPIRSARITHGYIEVEMDSNAVSWRVWCRLPKGTFALIADNERTHNERKFKADYDMADARAVCRWIQKRNAMWRITGTQRVNMARPWYEVEFIGLCD